jgi:hypothetical protein
MKEADYRAYFEESGLIEKADAWLSDNPKPKGWRGGKYSWAYTEMAVMPWEKFKVRKVRKWR